MSERNTYRTKTKAAREQAASEDLQEIKEYLSCPYDKIDTEEENNHNEYRDVQ